MANIIPDSPFFPETDQQINSITNVVASLLIRFALVWPHYMSESPCL